MKDNRQIIRGVRIGNQVFSDGLEDELCAVIDDAELAQLKEQKVLSGDWKSTKKPAPKK